MKTLIGLFSLTLTAAGAFAQQPAAPVAAPTAQVDARFAGWIGCWRLEDDLAGTGARMCVTPAPGGVRLQTVVGANKGIDELVIPDGAAHPIADAECKGHERAEFSKDNLRVFRSTEVTCGKEAPRTIKGVAFLAGQAWINVQLVTGAATTTAVRVQRYRRAANQQLADGGKAPQAAATALTTLAALDTKWSVDDVIEASAKIPAEAVQAALSELKHGFELNKKTLVALADADVHEGVIDLMVALTYPKRFVVQRAGGGSAPTGISTGAGWFDPFMTPMMYGTLSNCYTPFGYGYRSYYSMCGNGFYSPFGYDYFGYNRYGFDYYGNGYNNWVNLGSLPTATGIEPQAHGRVVNGFGYTQVRNRDAEPSPRMNNGGNGSSSGWTGAGGGGVSSSGYSSGSSSGGSSGGGGSSSSGDSGARTAVPKGGGQ